MEHRMRLKPSPFEKIKQGTKTIELRLYDEKRRKISIGDRICFVNMEDEGETLFVEVKNLYVFESFEKLYQRLPLTSCGYTQEDVHRASPRDMEEYYSPKQQAEVGVVGIEISLL